MKQEEKLKSAADNNKNIKSNINFNISNSTFLLSLTHFSIFQLRSWHGWRVDRWWINVRREGWRVERKERKKSWMSKRKISNWDPSNNLGHHTEPISRAYHECRTRWRWRNFRVSDPLFQVSYHFECFGSFSFRRSQSRKLHKISLTCWSCFDIISSDIDEWANDELVFISIATVAFVTFDYCSILGSFKFVQSCCCYYYGAGNATVDCSPHCEISLSRLERNTTKQKSSMSQMYDGKTKTGKSWDLKTSRSCCCCYYIVGVRVETWNTISLHIHAIYNIRKRSNESSNKSRRKWNFFFLIFLKPSNSTPNNFFLIYLLFLFGKWIMDGYDDGWNTVRCRQLSIKAHIINI